jgi:hypothetical protein
MNILAHRGRWTDPAERNGLDACTDAWRAGFGIETDIRDRPGEIVISHDPAPSGPVLDLEELLATHARIAPATELALNVKSCGLASKVADQLRAAGTQHAYVFDLAVPDALTWLSAGVPVFTRHSDVEPEPQLYDRSGGVWLDSFGPEWWNADVIERHVDAGKRVAIVSPELHGRDHRPCWDMLVDHEVWDLPGVAICTDFPDDAKAVFS